MAGFSKIKRKISRQVVGGGSVVIFEDLNPFEVEYQKFYDDEEMYYFSHEMFAPFKEKLPEGVYVFDIDTLDVYINSSVTYKIERTITVTAIADDLGIFNKDKTYF